MVVVSSVNMMDTIVRNIKSWKREFINTPCRTSELWSDQSSALYSSSIRNLPERQIAYVNNHEIAKELENRKERPSAVPGVHHPKPVQTNQVPHLKNNFDGRVLISNSKQYTQPMSNHQDKIKLDINVSKKEDIQVNQPNLCRMQNSSPNAISSSSDDGMDEDSYEEEEECYSSTESSMSEECEWKLVTNNKPSRSEHISSFCYYRALCMQYPKCKDKHTRKEKETFEARRIAKAKNDKEFSDTKFRTELCKVNVLHNLEKCRFAHGTEQVICRKCFEVGHKKESCKEPTEKIPEQ